MVMAAIIPLVVGTVALMRDGSSTHRFVIAPGTRAALMAGRTPGNLIPPRLEVSVGDTLEIVNRDTEAHTYAFMVLRPGETARHVFRQVGEFSGECTVNEHEKVTITVTR